MKKGTDKPDEKGFPTFQGLARFRDLATQVPKGSEIVEAVEPENGWQLSGYMNQSAGTDYPAQSSSDRRYPEFNIPDSKEYIDPIQGLPPRGVIRQVMDKSDDLNVIGGETNEK